MAGNTLSTNLCNYIVSRQQRDLLVIFEHFSDKVSDPENNTFFIQNEILDKILLNIEECKRTTISRSSFYKGITKSEKEIISSLNLDNKISHNAYHSKILGIEYFDENKFNEILEGELDTIASKYNLHADDDYNKLYKFLSSIQLILQSSDDVLSALSNQYVLYKEHSKYSNGENKDEYITIYGEKHYKIDILDKVIDSYEKAISENKKIEVNKPKTVR